MDSSAQQALQQILHEKGYSTTKARLLVCQLLWDKEPQTTRQLIDQLEGKIDRASIYRTITLFQKLGLINRIYIGWKYKIELSDILTHHHHHISCRLCGKVEAMHEEQDIKQLVAKLSNIHHFSAEHHTLEIQGLCADCQK